MPFPSDALREPARSHHAPARVLILNRPARASSGAGVGRMTLAHRACQRRSVYRDVSGPYTSTLNEPATMRGRIGRPVESASAAGGSMSAAER
jgi:hypothetical protein